MLCDLLGLKKLVPRKLVWEDRIYVGEGGGIDVPSDYAFIGGKRIILPKRLQNVLTPDEWKPILSTSLIMRSWARPRLVKTGIPAALIGLAFYLPILYLDIHNSSQNLVLAALANPVWAILVTVIAFVLLGRIYSPAAHMEVLTADLQVAGLIGRDLFLNTLRKIDSMGFKDVEKLERKSSRYTQPSIKERIRNLEQPRNGNERSYT